MFRLLSSMMCYFTGFFLLVHQETVFVSYYEEDIFMLRVTYIFIRYGSMLRFRYISRFEVEYFVCYLKTMCCLRVFCL
jgi:hypothetical protein